MFQSEIIHVSIECVDKPGVAQPGLVFIMWALPCSIYNINSYTVAALISIVIEYHCLSQIAHGKVLLPGSMFGSI